MQWACDWASDRDRMLWRRGRTPLGMGEGAFEVGPERSRKRGGPGSQPEAWTTVVNRTGFLPEARPGGKRGHGLGGTGEKFRVRTRIQAHHGGCRPLHCSPLGLRAAGHQASHLGMPSGAAGDPLAIGVGHSPQRSMEDSLCAPCHSR